VPSVMSNAANRLPDTAPPEVADGHRAVRDRERSRRHARARDRIQLGRSDSNELTTEPKSGEPI
jgi:hypothetical protein